MTCSARETGSSTTACRSTARQKEQQSSKPEPSWKETLDELAENARQRKALETWRPQTLGPEDVGFKSHAAYRACDQFLSFWVKRNYGGITSLVMKQLRDAYGNAMPRQINMEYSQIRLSQYAIRRLAHSMAAIYVIDVVLTLEGGYEKTASLRCTYEDRKGEPVVPPSAGEWHLMLWGPAAFVR